MPRRPATPSHLKWMVGKRARLAGELEILEEWLSALKLDHAKACTRALGLARQLEAATGQQERLLGALRALDTTMKLERKDIDVSQISAVRAQCGRYGKWGSLKNTIEQVLREVAPNTLSTDVIGARVAERLGVVHRNRRYAKRWHDKSLSPGLRALLNEGTVRKVGKGRTQKGQMATLWATSGYERESLADLAKKQEEARSKRG